MVLLDHAFNPEGCHRAESCGGIIRIKPSNVTEHQHLALEDQLRNVFHGSFHEQLVVGLEVEPPIPEDLPQAACSEGVTSWCTTVIKKLFVAYVALLLKNLAVRENTHLENFECTAFM